MQQHPTTKALRALDTELPDGFICYFVGCGLQLVGCDQPIYILQDHFTSWRWYQQGVHWSCKPNGIPVPCLQLFSDLINMIITHPQLVHVHLELRSVLLIALTIACGGSYLVEQPRSSLMEHYHRMEWLWQTLKPVSWLIYLAICTYFCSPPHLEHLGTQLSCPNICLPRYTRSPGIWLTMVLARQNQRKALPTTRSSSG